MATRKRHPEITKYEIRFLLCNAIPTHMYIIVVYWPQLNSVLFGFYKK